MSRICNGSRRSKAHFGNPKLAFSFKYINRFAGKMAISSAIIPTAAYAETIGMQSKMPKTISDSPLKIFNNFGFGKKGGIIRTYKCGFLKWFNPARMYNAAIKYKCQGKVISLLFRAQVAFLFKLM